MNVVNSRAMAGACLDEFTGVVAPSPANDDNNIALPGQFHGCGLTLFGGLANGVNKANFRVGKTAAKRLNQRADAIDGLGGLRGDTEARSFGEPGYFLRCQDDVKCRQIFGQAAHFHVATLANDDRMIAGRSELLNGTMGVMHQRASRFEQMQTAFLCGANGFFRSAVGGDHGRGGGDSGGVISGLHAARTEFSHDGFIMDEIPQDGERVFGAFRAGQGNGVADTEAHAEMGGPEDARGRWAYALYHKAI